MTFAPDTLFAINSPSVIFDEADGDIVIINLVSGHYFRMDAASGALWKTFASEQTAASITAACTNGSELSSSLPGILDDLVLHDLLRVTVAGQPHSPATLAQLDAWTFAGFTLENFTDLEDILGLDPIHEVDPERGWPHARSE